VKKRLTLSVYLAEEFPVFTATRLPGYQHQDEDYSGGSVWTMIAPRIQD
jgi:hypothetical protein